MGVMNIDKAEVACRFGRSIESYEEHAAVQREIAAHLAELAAAYVTQPPRKILEVGCGTGLLTERILQLWAGSELWVNDLVEGMCAKAAARCCVPAARCLVGDIESLPLPSAFDLLISASVFQWLARPAETFARLAACLQPGGWLAFSTFGEDNCHELREVASTGLAYPSADELRATLAFDAQTSGGLLLAVPEARREEACERLAALGEPAFFVGWVLPLREGKSRHILA